MRYKCTIALGTKNTQVAEINIENNVNTSRQWDTERVIGLL